MKFTKVSIDGYGRFSKKDVPLIGGLQVITGPNEQGKSTLRNFIADMLYGQKCGTSPRVYDDSNEMLTPWHKVENYGGCLEYALDSGRILEVERCFDRKNESVHIFDRTDGHEVTGEFTRLSNHEPAFADRHLGMSKEVFLGAATISHVTLDDLGDQQALVKIRERLLSLADSGDGRASAKEALKWLADRAASIGNATTRTHPLPLAKARLKALDEERDRAATLREELHHLEEERSRLNDRMAKSKRRRTELHHQLISYEIASRSERLKQAEDLSERIDSLTKKSFRKSALRDFPLDHADEAQRAIALVTAAEAKVRDAETEYEQTRKKLTRDKRRVGADESLGLEEMDPDYDSRLTEHDRANRQLSQSLESIEASANVAKSRLEETQSKLKGLPDFSQLTSNPVEWFTQQAGSFSEARRTRDNEVAKRDHLQRLLARKREEWKPLERLFSAIEDFHSATREFSIKTRESVERLAELEQASDAAIGRKDDLQSKLPAYALSSLLSIGAAGFFSWMSYWTGNLGILIPSLFFGLMFGCVLLGAILTRRGIRKAGRAIENLKQKMAEARLGDLNAREVMEGLMEQGGCQTIWELEALYDRYCKKSAELAVLEEQRVEQEQRSSEAIERVDVMYGRVRQKFLSLGERIKGEDGVGQAATNAIGRYQEYRDTKRRASESRDAYERHSKQLEELRTEYEASKKQELELSLEVRQLLRDNNYPEEQNCDSALKALQGYRIRSAQFRQAQRSIDVLYGKLEAIEGLLDDEKKALNTHQKALSRLFRKAGVETIEEFNEQAKQARSFESEWQQRSAMEEQLATVLCGEEISTLREAVATAEVAPKPSETPVAELREELDSLDEQIDALRKKEQDLHITIAERSGGVRSMNEVDEERAVVEKRMLALELELNAASYAASVLEETTKARHSQIAPQLAALASTYLEEITAGAYEEITIGPDVEIGVRIPQTKMVQHDAEQRLSKGTVDQIYLALRLAMVQSMSDKGERIPMLLDDPFANYDDDRLFRAMKVLSRVAENNQILLFSCREDVVRAARKIKATVIHL